MNPYQTTTIELKIEEDISLMILLHQDGTINRRGDGSPRIDNDFYMGIDKTGIFNELIETIEPEFEAFLNQVYDMPEKKGDVCSLEVTLSDGKETAGMRFLYGSKSVGPPKPVTDFVIKAIELTNPWFYEQQKMAGKKEWWEFWK